MENKAQYKKGNSTNLKGLLKNMDKNLKQEKSLKLQK